ncbi:hypothetical protein CS542_06180 [Pedobacter sp. IW39]|nr:hypothetical protein CS542_06180 [Pedobacter sp. IW39]
MKNMTIKSTLYLLIRLQTIAGSPKADLNHFVEVHGINAVIIATISSSRVWEWALSLKCIS